MSQTVKTYGSLVARNTLLNFIGQIVPLLVGIVVIPFIVRGLGIERFGILSLAWVVLGYFGIFDVGLGRATTKYVAEALGQDNKDQVPRLVWTAVVIQGIFGLIGALVLIGITWLFLGNILNVPKELLKEASATFYIIALGLPLVLVSSSFSGLLEATQRFDLLNAIKTPSSILTFLLPLIGIFLGFKLPGIVTLILVSRLVVLMVLVAFGFRVIPKLCEFSISLALLPRLFAYGGWITVTSVVGPMLVYLDRFLIAFLLSVASVTYYTIPYEAVTRLWIIPISLTMSLFPAFSALEVIGDRKKIEKFFARSVKYVLLLLCPIVLLLVLFAQPILQLWLGIDFAMQSKVVLQILALGVMVNSLAHIPYTLLQGIGRPDLTAKFHLIEMPFHLAITWVLIGYWGISGAAVAWTIRVTVDAMLLFIAAFKVCQLSPRLLLNGGLILTCVILSLLVGMAYGIRSLAGTTSFFVESILFIALLGLFARIVWKNIFDSLDRGMILGILRPWERSSKASL